MRLLSAYRQLHQQGRFPGLTILAYVDQIAHLVIDSSAKTLIDYGSGRGLQYSEHKIHHKWGGVMPVCFDPAVPIFHVKPSGQFDGTICVDVLEHIPEDELDDVIADLVGYSRLWCFVSVCCRPAKPNKNIAPGVNAHVTLKEEKWWWETLGAAFEGNAALQLEFTP